MTIWYLRQIYSDNEEKLVKDELKDGFKEVVKTELELKELEEKMSENPDDLNIIEKYTSLLEVFNNI